MIITGITTAEFEQAVAKAGALYEDNLRPEFGREYSARRFNATVKLKVTGYQMGFPTQELAPGQNRSASGRRTAAVCWHVYRDVLIEVFNINPDAKVATMYAKYYGSEAFYELFPATGSINRGSMFAPIGASQTCDCFTN